MAMSEKLSFPAGASAPSLPMPGLNVPRAGDARLAPPDVHACTRLCRRRLGAGRPHGERARYVDCTGEVHGHAHHGRGCAQLTWQADHLRCGRALGLGERLAAPPELALDPAISCRVLSHGMRNGLFTGRRLAEFIAGPGCGYFERMLRWALA